MKQFAVISEFNVNGDVCYLYLLFSSCVDVPLPQFPLNDSFSLLTGAHLSCLELCIVERVQLLLLC